MPDREFYLWHVRGFTVRLRLDVVSELNQQLGDPRRNLDQEHGGILLGRVLGPALTEVTGFEFLQSEHRRGVLYDLGARERERVSRYVQDLNKRRGPRPVGFFRTHRRPGLFLDQDDFLLMSDVFAHPSSVALVIRPNARAEASGPPDAGIFFWKDHDIDRKQSALMFPFDTAALRARGPIQRDIQTVQPPVAKKPVFPWGMATVAGMAVVLLALAALAALPRRHPARSVPEAPIADLKPEALSVVPAEPEHLAPPAANSRVAAPTPDAAVELAPPMVSVPDKTEPRPAFSAPPSAPRTESVVAETLPRAPEKAPEPVVESGVESAPPAVVRPKPRERRVLVHVAMEPRQPSEILKVIGHVPLLGRLHRFRKDEDTPFEAARPKRNLAPKVPEYMATNLDHEVPIDVKVSIDKDGRVKDTEVLHGAGTGFGSLAADAVASTAWTPAQMGNRRVSSEMVVHYRFRPAE